MKFALHDDMAKVCRIAGPGAASLFILSMWELAAIEGHADMADKG